MVVRKRVRVKTPAVVSGGTGTPTTANLQIGPDFGEGAGSDDTSHTIGVEAELTGLRLENDKSVGVDLDLTDLSVVFNEQQVGINLDLDAVALENDKSIGVNLDLDSLALENDKTVGVDLDLTSLALENEKGVGIHMSGTALGAPFWQSAETATGTTTITVNKPANTAENDLLVAFVGAQEAAGSPDAINAPAGWTGIENTAFSTMRLRSFYKVATAAEPANYAFTVTAAVAVLRGVGEIHRITGNATASPIDVSTSATLSAAALDPDPDSPSVTTTVANTLVFASLLHDHLAVSQSHTPTGSHDERTDFQHNASAAFLGSHGMTRVFSAIAATGTVEHDCTQAAGTDAIMHRVAVKPGPVELAP